MMTTKVGARIGATLAALTLSVSTVPAHAAAAASSQVPAVVSTSPESALPPYELSQAAAQERVVFDE